MNTALIIVTILSIIYFGVAIYKAKRIPESISETSYIWEQGCTTPVDKNGPHKAYLFSFYCALVAGLMFWPWMSQTRENIEFLCFLGCAGILAAAVTPFFKEKYQAPVHYGGGMVAVISWFVWMLCMKHVIELAAALIVLFFLIECKKESYVFWTEIVGLVTLILCLL